MTGSMRLLRRRYDLEHSSAVSEHDESRSWRGPAPRCTGLRARPAA